MKKLLMAAAGAAALTTFAPVGAQATAPVAAAPKKPMTAKAVTRSDVTQQVQQRFARLDSNRDGFVTEAESDAAANAAHERVGQRLDKRGDAMFARLDTNKDGNVTRPEVDAAFARNAKQSAKDVNPPSWDRIASRLDANKDGAISREEFSAAHDRRADRIGKRVDGMFENADANKDGRVSLAEATAAATARFDVADANRDGTLTAAEIRQSRQKTKGNAPGS